MVEHDREVIRSADHLLDFGPQAGAAGGRIVASGPPTSLLNAQVSLPAGADAGAEQPGDTRSPASRAVVEQWSTPDESLTRAYLCGAAAIPIPSNRRGISSAAGWLTVRGARQHNLKNIDVAIPLGRFVCVTGVSGSGKSSLVNDILWPALANQVLNAHLPLGDHDDVIIEGDINDVANVDQSPIGTTPASNPATYTGVFDSIRALFARLPDSKIRGYTANRFSFNRPGGRCEACEGQGQRRIEMHFMPDVWVECETCRGRRYNAETLEVRFKGKSIADVLDMSVAEALKLFENVPRVRRMLQTLADVGLDYVPLGQPAPTLSGGEAQRVKLAAELGQPDTGRTFYILDEPTTGLHFDDIRKLLAVIHRLVDLGNSVLVVEHNLDVIKCADWIIDLGPEAGAAGGQVVAAGTPEQIVQSLQRGGGAGLAVAEGVVAEPRRGARPRGVPKGGGSARLQAGRAGTISGAATAGHSVCFSHTAAALEPILRAGPYAERARYDPHAQVAQLIDGQRDGFGDVGRDVRMPWQTDGRKWHLEQRRSRTDQPRRWEPAALEYVLELVQQAGRALCGRGGASLFEPTNWSNRASVEVTAGDANIWFLHALTGGEWLLELYFQVPRGTFKWHELDAQLGLKTLDERADLETYGDWSRVDVRPRRGGLDAVVVYVHDKREIDTPGFRRFIRDAVRAYAAHVRPTLLKRGRE